MRREVKTITKEEALAQLNVFLAEHYPAVGPKARWDGVYHVFTRGIWGDECRVDARLPYGGTEWQVNIGWSSTHRSIQQAVSTLETYRQAIEFAATIRTFIDSLSPIAKEDK